LRVYELVVGPNSLITKNEIFGKRGLSAHPPRSFLDRSYCSAQFNAK
jgi:hypothetical protein